MFDETLSFAVEALRGTLHLCVYHMGARKRTFVGEASCNLEALDTLEHHLLLLDQPLVPLLDRFSYALLKVLSSRKSDAGAARAARGRCMPTSSNARLWPCASWPGCSCAGVCAVAHWRSARPRGSRREIQGTARWPWWKVLRTLPMMARWQAAGEGCRHWFTVAGDAVACGSWPLLSGDAIHLAAGLRGVPAIGAGSGQSGIRV